jgi:Cys-rich four helix bundle protein (predicted Tat secretion target)
MAREDAGDSPTHAATVGRRELLLAGAGAAVLWMGAGRALAAEHEQHGHEKHYFEAKAPRAHRALTVAANDCVAKGQVCLSHCFETFRLGDTTMAECATAVQEMLSVCTALGNLAAYDSRYLKDMARVCIPVCEGCEKECRIHEQHQPECKDCADACAVVVREARKLLG